MQQEDENELQRRMLMEGLLGKDGIIRDMAIEKNSGQPYL